MRKAAEGQLVNSELRGEVGHSDGYCRRRVHGNLARLRIAIIGREVRAQNAIEGIQRAVALHHSPHGVFEVDACRVLILRVDRKHLPREHVVDP